jgi:hypothetical protein
VTTETNLNNDGETNRSPAYASALARSADMSTLLTLADPLAGVHSAYGPAVRTDYRRAMHLELAFFEAAAYAPRC